MENKQVTMDWKWIAEHLGVPMVFVCILCFAIYQTGSWTANHIFTPLVEKHIEFLTTEQANMKTIAEAVGKQSSEQLRQSAEQLRQTKLLEDIRNDQRKFPAVAEKNPLPP